MRILFAGTPKIAVPSLKALTAEFEICGVLTNPDRKTGRGRKIISSPVCQTARELDLKILQPEKLDSAFLNEVKTLKPDLLVVIAFGKIFRKDFLDLFPMGGINLHPSLLPRYRGPSPLNEAIKNGDKVIGLTVQKVALNMDSGDILLQPVLELDGTETTGSLSDKVADLGAPLVVEAVKILEKDRGAGIPQDHLEATFCKLITKEEGEIDWSQSAEEIERQIRAYYPWPGAYSWYEGKKLNILEAGLAPVDTAGGKPGTVLSFNKKEGILIATGRGVLAIRRLQLQSKKPMDYKSFYNGNRNFVGSTLDRPSGDNQ